MCQRIIINPSKECLETPRAFQDYFGFPAEMDKRYKSVDVDSCFCQVDIEETFKKHGIIFSRDGMDYYVGISIIKENK